MTGFFFLLFPLAPEGAQGRAYPWLWLAGVVLTMASLAG